MVEEIALDVDAVVELITLFIERGKVFIDFNRLTIQKVVFGKLLVQRRYPLDESARKAAAASIINPFQGIVAVGDIGAVIQRLSVDQDLVTTFTVELQEPAELGDEERQYGRIHFRGRKQDVLKGYFGAVYSKRAAGSFSGW